MKAKQSGRLALPTHTDVEGEHISLGSVGGEHISSIQHLGLLKLAGELLSGDTRIVKTQGVEAGEDGCLAVGPGRKRRED